MDEGRKWMGDEMEGKRSGEEERDNEEGKERKVEGGGVDGRENGREKKRGRERSKQGHCLLTCVKHASLNFCFLQKGEGGDG